MRGRSESGRSLWLLAIALALVVTFGIVVFAAISYMSGSTEREMEDPIAYAQKLTTVNRDLEIVEISRGDRLIRAKHTPSGNILLFTFDDIQAGRVQTSRKGELLNAAVRLLAPPWIPVYPGWKLTSSTQTNNPDEGDTGTIKFHSADKLEQVKNFYETNLVRENVRLNGEKDLNGEWFLEGVSEDQRRKVILRLAPRSNGTAAELQFRSR